MLTVKVLVTSPNSITLAKLVWGIKSLEQILCFGPDASSLVATNPLIELGFYSKLNDNFWKSGQSENPRLNRISRVKVTFHQRITPNF